MLRERVRDSLSSASQQSTRPPQAPLRRRNKGNEDGLCVRKGQPLGTGCEEDSSGNNFSLSGNLDLPALPLIAFNGPIVLFADEETGIYGESWFLEFCQGACG